MRLKKWALLIVGVILLVVGLWRWQHKPPPSFEGRSAGQWLQDLTVTGRASLRYTSPQQAFLAMGTDGVDFLREELTARDAPFKRLLIALDEKVPWVRVKWVRDSDRRLRAVQAANILGQQVNLEAELLTAFADTSVKTQLGVFKPILIGMGNDKIPLMVQSLDSRVDEVRREKLLYETWRTMLLDHPPDEKVTGALLDFSIKRLSKTDMTVAGGSVATHAAWMIASFGSNAAPAIPALVKASQSADDYAQIAAAAALGAIAQNPETVVPILTKLLEHRRGGVRLAAAKALSRFGAAAAPAVSALAIATTDPEPSVVVAAASALRRIGSAARSASPALAACLDSKDPMIRMGAALALAKVNPEPVDVLPGLIRLLQDDSLDVRVVAADCLGELHAAARPAVEPLIAALKANPERVQASVIEALGKIGPAARMAVPHLRVAWNNNQSALGRRAAEALARIERGE